MTHPTSTSSTPTPDAAEQLRGALAMLEQDLQELRNLRAEVAGPATPAADTPRPSQTFAAQVHDANERLGHLREVGALTAAAAPAPSAGVDADPDNAALLASTLGRSTHATGSADVMRLAAQLVAAREELGHERGLREAAEARVQELTERLQAARAIVSEAQDLAREAGDRAAYFEGRVDSLESSLDQVVNASLVQRWKWRRSLRRGS